MSFVLDIILLALAVLIIVLGFKRGLFKSVSRLLCTVCAGLLAYAFTPKLAGVFRDKFLLNRISGSIFKTVSSLTEGGANVANLKEGSAADQIGDVLSKFNVDTAKFNGFVDSVSDKGEAAVTKISRFIASPVANVIANAAAFLLIFIASFFVLRFAAWLISKLFKLPGLKTADKIAGLIFGIICALLTLWILSLVIKYGASALGSVSGSLFGKDVVDKTVIVKLFSENNPVKILENVIRYTG